MQSIAQSLGQVVQRVRAVNLNCLARRVQRNFAVVAAVQMVLQLAARLQGDLVVNQIVKQCKKFRAGHFSPPFFLLK